MAPSKKILACLLPAIAAIMFVPRPCGAQDFVASIETRSFPMENRVRTVYTEEDLTPRAYVIVLPQHTLVLDNLDEILARRSSASFDARFAESRREERALFDLYDRLSR
jgi:hypothetical protein